MAFGRGIRLEGFPQISDGHGGGLGDHSQCFILGNFLKDPTLASVQGEGKVNMRGATLATVLRYAHDVLTVALVAKIDGAVAKTVALGEVANLRGGLGRDLPLTRAEAIQAGDFGVGGGEEVVITRGPAPPLYDSPFREAFVKSVVARHAIPFEGGIFGKGLELSPLSEVHEPLGDGLEIGGERGFLVGFHRGGPLVGCGWFIGGRAG